MVNVPTMMVENDGLTVAIVTIVINHSNIVIMRSI